MRGKLGLAFAFLLTTSNCGVSPKNCTPTNCPGCCDEDGECLAGTGLFECGAAGVKCDRCEVTDSCRAGACAPLGDGGIYDAGHMMMTTGAGGGTGMMMTGTGGGMSGTGGGAGGAGGAGGGTAVVDAGRDAGVDAGKPDAGVDAGKPDAGIDAGVDAGKPDAGVDAGFDAGIPDAGRDGGTDAGDGG